jgi:hypothetical protein
LPTPRPAHCGGMPMARSGQRSVRGCSSSATGTGRPPRPFCSTLSE